MLALEIINNLSTLFQEQMTLLLMKKQHQHTHYQTEAQLLTVSVQRTTNIHH